MSRVSNRKRRAQDVSLRNGSASDAVRQPEGYAGIWRSSPLFEHLHEWQVGGTCLTCNVYSRCNGGCMAVKRFIGRSLGDTYPDCVFGNGEEEGENEPGTDGLIPLQVELKRTQGD